MSFLEFLKKWWLSLAFDPHDPRYSRGDIKIVAIGGGTGISNLLRGLKKYSKSISAIVAVSDSGRSSGVIRKVFKILPPGDIRKCLAALSEDWQEFSDLFEFRFPKGSGFLADHTMGNICIAALSRKYNSFEKAIKSLHRMLDAVGVVYPSTLDNVQIAASYTDGSRVVGEDKIPFRGKQVKKVFFTKKRVNPYRPAIKAISEADLIIIGPGSLFTSIIPNLLISKIVKVIENNKKATKIFIANISTERGETEKMTILDHIKAIESHSGRRLFDYVLVNSKIVRKSKKVAELGEINNITLEGDSFEGYAIVKKDIVDRNFPLYHDKEKLAKELILLYNDVRRK
jgi:uncharacterized cofD-like protein